MWKINNKVKERLKLDELTVKRIEKIMGGYSDNRPLVWCDYCSALNHANNEKCNRCKSAHWFGIRRK